MTPRISKHMLETQQLLELTALIGMTEVGDAWCGILGSDMQSLVNKKLVQVVVTSEPAAEAGKFYERKQFYLTQRGGKFLLLWPLEELLELIRVKDRQVTRSDYFHIDLSLAYVINRLPIEQLSEFLVHRYFRVREAANKRLERLTV